MEMLNDHEDRIKHQQKRLATQDAIVAKTLEILESLNDKHMEYMGITRATHGMVVTSYFRWHGDEEVVECLKT